MRHHFLVKWLRFIVTMRDERISYTKPFSFDPYSKCLTVVAPCVGQEDYQKASSAFWMSCTVWSAAFSNSQCSVVYSAVYRMVPYPAAAFQPDVSSMLPGQEFSVFVRPLPQSQRKCIPFVRRSVTWVFPCDNSRFHSVPKIFLNQDTFQSSASFSVDVRITQSSA